MLSACAVHNLESVDQTRPGEERTPASPGLKLIIAYKVAKVPVMFALSLWLTLAPSKAYHTVEHVAYELSNAGHIFARLGEWIASHLSLGTLRGAAFLAWFDTLFTAAEAVLLILRKPWSEWMVAIGLSALLPFEIASLVHHFRVGKLAVFVINAAVVCYLVWRRTHQRKPAPSARPAAGRTAPTAR